VTNYERTAAWLMACGKEPTTANLSVQIGCHIEEFIELLGTLDFASPNDQKIVSAVMAELNYVSKNLKTRTSLARIRIDQREQALDALCDGEVTGNGIAFLAATRSAPTKRC